MYNECITWIWTQASPVLEKTCSIFQIKISKLPVKANKVDVKLNVSKLLVKVGVYINDAWLDSNH